MNTDVEMQVKLERLRLVDALSARDAIAKHLVYACLSINEKSSMVERLHNDNQRLETEVEILKSTAKQILTPPGLEHDAKQDMITEIENLTELFENLQEAKHAENQSVVTQAVYPPADQALTVSARSAACMRLISERLCAYSLDRVPGTVARGDGPSANSQTS